MTQNWENFKRALLQPPSPEAMKAAGEAFRKVALGRATRLVNLGRGTSYPNVIPLEKIPDELSKNPQFFGFMQKLITRGKR